MSCVVRWWRVGGPQHQSYIVSARRRAQWFGVVELITDDNGGALDRSLAIGLYLSCGVIVTVVRDVPTAVHTFRPIHTRSSYGSRSVGLREWPPLSARRLTDRLRATAFALHNFLSRYAKMPTSRSIPLKCDVMPCTVLTSKYSLKILRDGKNEYQSLETQIMINLRDLCRPQNRRWWGAKCG